MEVVAIRYRGIVGRSARRGSLALLAAFVGLSLALFGPLLGGSKQTIALACGLGSTPTMLANQAPALLYPVTTNVPIDQPIGIFALNYVAGQQITFSEDLSRVLNAPDPTTLKWRWDFGDGSTPSSDIHPSHTFASAGAYNVHSQIYDTTTSSWTDLDSAAIHVIAAAIANPPVAHITASASATTVNGSVSFDATGSHASDGSAVTYLWNFNDGTTATTAKVTHTFSTPGQGFVALIVTDARGARTVATTNILIASGTLDTSASAVSPGVAVNFDATQSGGVPFPSYSWDFGDGTPAQSTESPTISHTFARAGSYTVIATASDPEQGARETFFATVSVIAPPTAKSGVSWLPIVGVILAVLLVGGGGAFLVQAQRRRTALIKRQVAATELARAKQVGARGRGQKRPDRPLSPRPGSPTRPVNDPRRAGPTGPTARERPPRRDPHDGEW